MKRVDLYYLEKQTITVADFDEYVNFVEPTPIHCVGYDLLVDAVEISRKHQRVEIFDLCTYYESNSILSDGVPIKKHCYVAFDEGARKLLELPIANENRELQERVEILNKDLKILNRDFEIQVENCDRLSHDVFIAYGKINRFNSLHYFKRLWLSFLNKKII